jgi:competence protein ComFC
LSTFDEIKEILRESLFPSDGQCVLCKRLLIFERSPFCFYCMGKVHWIGESVCEKCGKEEIYGHTRLCLDCNYNIHNYHQGIALFTYTREGKKIIQDIKFQGNKKLGRDLGDKLGQKIKTKNWDEIHMILPVPLHPNRERERGFNQSWEIARGITKSISSPLVNNLLIRVRDTPHQTDLTKRERERNIKNAFSVKDQQLVVGKTILLVDDVYTTGSTINECGKVLMDGGAEKVYFAVLAIGQR